MQENRVLTPFLFTLLLLIVFFVWVNVMVAIISEVYQQECDDALNISWDEDFPSMSPSVPQPQNDLDAMRLHYPVQSLSNEASPQPVALEPERCPPPPLPPPPPRPYTPVDHSLDHDPRPAVPEM